MSKVRVTRNFYTSGTQALQGRTVNHDPEPYISEQGTRQPWSMLGVCEYAPRPEFDVLDNPVLADIRGYRAERLQMNNPKGWVHVLRAFERAAVRNPWGGTDEQLEHTRRVLTRLAAIQEGEA